MSAMKHRKSKVFRKKHPSTGAQPGTLVIPAEAPPPRIHVTIYNPQSMEEREVTDVASLPGLLRPDAVVWVDVQGFGNEQILRAIGSAFNLHPLALEDIVNTPGRPKLEVFSEYSLMVMRMMRLSDPMTVHREQVSVVLGKGFVLSFQESYSDLFEPVRVRIRQGGPIFRSSGPSYLAYALIDAVIDGYFPLLESVGDTLTSLEQEILTACQTATVQQVHHIKRELLAVRRAVWPMREVMNSLVRDDIPFISDNLTSHLRDCYDHCVQVIDVVETHRELAGSLIDLYLSSVANRQNEVMKTLTIIATIFIPLTFLAGIYGMNFEHMPELHTRWGYPILLAIMAVLAVVMVAGFWRRGWLGGREEASQDEVK